MHIKGCALLSAIDGLTWTSPGRLVASCTNCSLHQLCLPMGLDVAGMARLDQIIGRGQRLLRDNKLCRMGGPFQSLYAIRFGHFKTYQISNGGEQQITGLQMAGELLGMDAVSSGHHHCDAVAPEDIGNYPRPEIPQLFD